MKAVFFDTQPYEKDFLLKNIPEGYTYALIKEPLNRDYPLNNEISDTELISVFITSNLDKEVLERFKNLKFILTRSVGFSHIDLEWCKEKGIFVFNTPHYGDYTVAEYTFGLLIYTIRNMGRGAAGVKTDEINMNSYTGVELFSKTLGVIGAGSIGRNVLDIAHGFKMETLAYDPNPQDEKYNYTSLDNLFEKSDVISINSPLTDETYHLINKNTIEKMKDGVIIVNAARGEIIDTEALYEALLSKKIAYAALDVIECEEILCTHSKNCTKVENIKEECLEKFYLNQKLLKLPNVTITPHMAYNTKEAVERILEMTKENLISCLNFNSDSGAKNLVLL